MATVSRHSSEAVDQGLSAARTLVAHLPGTVRATQTGTNATTRALQRLPNSILQGLAASSIGLGAGFYLARLPRLLTAAAVAPAMIIGAAIILRPGDQLTRPETAR
jgi:hypothetical protein